MPFDSFSSRGESAELFGTVEHIVYCNEENGYTVCEIGQDEENEDAYCTAVGILPFLAVGDQIRAMGRWEVHPTHGKQFRVESFEKELPSDEGAILRYLSSRSVKGIGPITAKRIVEKYGTDSFDVIENHPDWIAEIPGISQKKAEQISADFKKQFGIRAVMMFCSDYFGPAKAVRVYKRWGGNAVDMIRENPYLLCEEITGIGFETSDRIARSLGIPVESQDRVRAGIKYMLNDMSRSLGHVCLPFETLCEEAGKLLDVGETAVRDAVRTLISLGDLVLVKRGEDSFIYLTELFDAEKYIALKLDLLDKLCDRLSTSDVNRFVSQIEYESAMEYAVMQKKAIISALENGVMILTGGPGTGKTTIIHAVLRIFDRMGLKVALAAPTGRAAKRMSEATGLEARTIHRLLEMEYTEGELPRFNRNEKDQLEQDVIVVDEMSMVDTLLCEALLRAVKPGARVILIGDADQLPSVGAGNVLCDLIESGRFATVKLTEIFRQAGESLIVSNAHAINEGRYPRLDVKDNDFFFVRREENAIAQTVVDLWLNRLPRTYGKEIIGQIQVITPSHKGVAGTMILNAALQAALNPPSPMKREKKVRDTVFREGDKVMQTRNNYDVSWEREDGTTGMGVFNGDIGSIERIDYENETVHIRFDDRECDYEFSLLEEIEHAYAVTIHKSQGSEYPVVILPAFAAAPMLQTRNLLYTAVTRAQKMVIAVGREDVLRGMVDNDRHVHRHTGLVAQIRALSDDEDR